MKNSEIISKAIEKAEANGWKSPFHTTSFQLSESVWGAALPAIIFSHDFARAFWGVSRHWLDKKHVYAIPEWQYQLQKIVLEENQLKYLEQFI